MAKHAWTQYAVLQSSQGGKEWRVDRNEIGEFRCSCPSFIFCKVQPRTCKHCRRCEQQVQHEASAAPKNGAVAARPSLQPNVVEATKMFAEMSVAAQAKAKVNVGNTLGAAATKAMIDVLAMKLAIYVAPAQPAAVEAIGVRRITFDD